MTGNETWYSTDKVELIGRLLLSLLILLGLLLASHHAAGAHASLLGLPLM